MGGRIIGMQHRLRTIGRIRLGTYEGRPKASEFFIPTSEFEHPIRQMGDLFGGDVEQWKPQGDGGMQWRLMNPDLTSLDAIIPPGRDPIDQAYEKWSRGGKQARCDGETVEKLNRPCVCKDRWGPRFWEKAPKDQACKLYTRANLWFPDVEDIGTWLLETKGANAGAELPGFVDMMRGMFGESVALPVRIWLVPRTGREPGTGKIKHYTKVEIEIRGMTAGQAAAHIMAAAPALAELGAAEDRLAIESAKPDQLDYAAMIAVAQTRDTVIELWRKAKADRDVWMTSGKTIEAAAGARVKEIERLAEAWKNVVTAWEGGDMDALHGEFTDFTRGRKIEEATAEELEAFLATIKAPEPPPAEPVPTVQAPAGRSAEDMAVPPDDEIEDADVVDDPEEPRVAEARLTPMNIAIGERGITSHTGKGMGVANKAAKAEWLSKVVDRPVTSTKELTEREADKVMAALKDMPITHPAKQTKAAQQAQQQQDPAVLRSHMLALFYGIGITGVEDVLRDISIITGDTLTTAAPPTPAQTQAAIDVLESSGGDVGTYDAMVSQIQEARAEANEN